VSLPAAFFSGATLLALPWAVALAFGFQLGAPWLPYSVAAIGLIQSVTTRRTELDIEFEPSSSAGDDTLRRYQRGTGRVARPVRIAQITDPHLGPFMSPARLERICARVVEHNPDLVLLTGDFLTMESQADPAALAHALSPLSALRGRVFACFGNHDHEAPKTVRTALRETGATLLVDRAQLVSTEAGLVQIVGFDFVWRNRQAHVERVCRDNPPVPGALRLFLLHDPGAFRYVPPDDGSFVLSGHTHGGQVGLLSLGLPWTMLRLLMNAPDHGLWRRNLLYVHRGTGHYGFPLRVGVSAEESVLSLHLLKPPQLPAES
jgi:predicted MPP superfamily phosphohydrolase